MYLCYERAHISLFVRIYEASYVSLSVIHLNNVCMHMHVCVCDNSKHSFLCLHHCWVNLTLKLTASPSHLNQLDPDFHLELHALIDIISVNVTDFFRQDPYVNPEEISENGSWMNPFVRISAKMYLVLYWPLSHPLTEFHGNLFFSLCVILQTNKQAERNGG